jgi:formate C-acetyltransferase
VITRGFSQPTERIGQLKARVVNAKPRVEAKRATLVTEAYKETENLPIILRRAKALEKILGGLPVVIRPGELIVGSMTETDRSCQIFPEFSFEWVANEFDTMSTRMADPFEISKETAKELSKDFEYWPGKTNFELATALMSEEAKNAQAKGLFTVGNYWYNGIGHVCVQYWKILKKGCIGVIADAVEAMKKLDHDAPDWRMKHQFYEAVVISFKAVIDYAKRHADKAEEMAAGETNPTRKAELLRIAKNCRKVPANPSTNFYEACQAFWFVQLIMQLESNGHSISPGRFDQYMYPYYKMDQGITEDFAQELIDCLWVKMSDINKTRDAISDQAFAGYQCFQNLCVGGQTADGEDATNEISYMCMTACAHVRLSAPSFSVRIHQNTPSEFLLRACEVVREGLGYPAMYNDEVIIPALMNRGVTLADARNYCIIGCVEPQCPGKTEGWHDAAFFNIAKILEITLNNGKIGDEQIGPVTGDPCDFKCIEDVWQAYHKQMEYFVRLLAEADNCVDMAHAIRCPLPFQSALVDDCMAVGKSVQEGGAHYNFTGPQAFGIADSGDSMYALDQHVFVKKDITMKQLMDALHTNFGHGDTNCVCEAENKDETEEQLYNAIKAILSSSGSIDVSQLQKQLSASSSIPASGKVECNGDYETLRKMLDNTECYGNDNDEVDMFARRCGQIYAREVQKYKNPRGGQFQAGIYPVSANVLFGKDVLALPDGRLAHKPLADGVSPRAGKDVNGPTAAAMSVAKLDHEIASNGTLYNMKFMPASLAGETGLNNFSSVVRSYFDHKGMHVQFNVVDRATLIDAQKHPENYKDLIVRVAGYSANFVVLAKEVQDDIINRTEHVL